MESKVAGNATRPKTKHRKGLWSPEEDRRLRDYILKYGHGCWSSVPANAGLQRNGKSCRLRWINYLRPGLKRGMFTVQEEETILRLHRSLGNKWSQIAQHLPGRTDNEIKNYWHTYLKKKVAKHGLSKPHTKSERSAGATDCSSFPDPSHEFSCSPAKPTDLSSLPQSILFAEWLNLNNNINENAHEECSDCYSFYGDDDLIRMICSDSMIEYNVNKLQDSLIQNTILSDVDNGAFGGAELIDGSYKKMEGPSLESGFLLDFTPRDQICGSDEFTMRRIDF